MSVNALHKVRQGQHGPECKRTFPLIARGFFLQAQVAGQVHTEGMADDAARALLRATLAAQGLHLTDVSRMIGANPAYVQQYLNRGIPRTLPEDKREALAAILGLDPDALRGAEPAKGAPKAAAPDAVAVDVRELEWLRLWRSLPPDRRETVAQMAKALLPT